MKPFSFTRTRNFSKETSLKDVILIESLLDW